MQTALLLDANLLLLLVLGSFDLRLVRSFKRLSNFSITDFQVLRDFTRRFRPITTPHVLTEVSNLANALPQDIRLPWLRYFASVITSMEEQYRPSSELAATELFVLFGITDSALASLPAGTILVTEDGRLRSYLVSQGRKVLNLDDIRRLRTAASKQV